jgi:hypothetical protein
VTRLRAALTAIALLATVLLTGCSQGSPNTAAVVNGVVISESTVENEAAVMPTITDSTTGVPYTAQEIRSIVLRYSVLGEIARQVATQQNLSLGTLDTTTATDPESVALVASPAGNSLLQDAYAWSALRKQLTTTDTSTNVTDTSALQAALMAESVVLNPRYGTWDVAAAAKNSALSASTGSMSDLKTK